MIIAISGLTGSGKNTLGEQLAEELGYKLVCPTFKDLAKREGIPLMEFQKRAEKDPKIDKKFDAALREQTKNGSCVVTTWLGPWIVKNAELKIHVFAPLQVRAERVAKRDGMAIAQAKKHIIERDEENRKRYQKVYGIDIYDTSGFDLCLSSAKLSKEQMRDIALSAVKIKSGAPINRK